MVNGLTRIWMPLMDPGADAGAGGGGGAGATGTTAAASSGNDAQVANAADADAKASAAQSAPDPLKISDPLLSPAKPQQQANADASNKAAGTQDAADAATKSAATGDSPYKGISDKFAKGDGQAFDDPFFAANPHAKGLADGYNALEKEYGKSQQSLSDARSKSVEKHGLPDGLLQTLDLATDEDGKLSKETRDAFIGKVITPQFADYMEQFLHERKGFMVEQNTTWKAEIGTKLGIQTDEVLQWATASGFYNEAQLAKFSAALSDPDMRDMTIQRLAEDYMGAGAVTGMSKPPLQTGNTAGAGASETGQYGDDLGEYMADIAKANGVPAEIAKADAKLARSQRLIHKTSQRMTVQRA